MCQAQGVACLKCSVCGAPATGLGVWRSRHTGMVRSVWPPSGAEPGQGGAEAPSSGRCGSLRAELGRGAGQHPTGGRCLPGRSGPFRVGGLGMSPGPGWTAGPHLAVRGRVATGGSARPSVPSSAAGRPLHRAAKGHRPGFGTAPQPASGPPFSRPPVPARAAHAL